jgi:site-specific DNA recombinase
MRAFPRSARVQQATIDSQLAALRERAIQDGHVVLPIDEYIDNGHSGSTLRRPGLERLRDRIAEGAVDVVYVHNPDRLARRYAHQVLLLDEFAAQGVRVMMLQGRGGESAEDQLLTQVQGVIAEYERTKIMERSRRGKLHKARAGSVNVMSCAPYGYLYVKKSDSVPAHYQVKLHEARVVRRIFEAVVRDHKSLCAVARMLNEQHVPPRGPAKHGHVPRWRAAAIHVVLRNPSYMGEAAFGKTENVARAAPLRLVIGRAAVSKRLKTGCQARPVEQWIRIPVPPIVSKDVFAAASVQLERNRMFAQRNRTMGRYLLAGLGVCARCGYGYYGRTEPDHRGRESARYTYYFCCSSVRGNQIAATSLCCNRPVRGDQLEAHVWQSVSSLLKDPARVMQEWSRRSDTLSAKIEHDAQREEALRAVRSHERALQRLVDGYEAGAIEVAELKTRSDRVRERMARARDELTALEKVLTERRDLQLVVGRIEEFAKRVGDGLDAISWDERRAVVRALVARVEIDNDDVTIVYRIPAVAATAAPGPPGPPVAPSGGLGGCVLGARTPAYFTVW